MMRGAWGGVFVAMFVAPMIAVGCGSDDSTGGTPSGGAPPTTTPSAPAARANGTIGEWQTLGAMPTPRGNHCAVVAKGWLIVIGGNYKPVGASEFETSSDVHAAKIAKDGSLGPWKLAGKTQSPVASCTAATDGNDVFLVDGIFDGQATGDAPNKVRRATLAEDGTLGELREIGSLPEGVRVLYSYAAVDDGTLRAFHAKLPESGDGVALVRAPVAGDGLGKWEETTWLTGFRGHPQYAVARTDAGSFVYALGGYASAEKKNAVLADGAGASLDQSGAPGKSFTVKPLPKPTAFGKAVAVDDWVFVVGGKDGVIDGKGRGDVFASKVGDGGGLDAWTSLAPLPQGRTSHAVVVSGDFLYVVGGGYDAGGLDTVFSARIRFPSP
jgi:hypothetical protein